MKPMSRAQTRDAAESQFVARMRLAHPEHPVLLHRLLDVTDVNKLAKKMVPIPKQPSDFIVRTYSELYMAEVKGTTNKTSFNLGNFEPSQRGWISYDLSCAERKYFAFIRAFYTDEWFKLSSEELKRWMGRTIKFQTLRDNNLQWRL